MVRAMKTHTLEEKLPLAEGLKTTVRLNNGVAMPWLGLGTFQVENDDDVERVVRAAVDLGYRSFDTAAIYGNERGVGRALRACGVPREELFVTTKLWNDDVRRDRPAAAFEESLRRLGLEYVDLYLVHWPITGKLVPAWRALEQLHAAGRVRAIGVSNHMVPHLEEVLAAATVVPAVNQIEFHPYLQSSALVAYCQSRGIVVEAWSPLLQGGALLQDPVLAAIAGRHERTPAQVVLRWNLQRGVVTIPKTARPERLAENAAVFDFALTPAEMEQIDALERHQRNGADPFNFGF